MRNTLLKIINRFFPQTQKEVDVEKLKEQLYEEYLYYEEAANTVDSQTKYNIAILVKKPEWASFEKLLERYKAITFSKGTTHGKNTEDLFSMNSRCRIIAMLKSFSKRYENVEIPENLTKNDPADTIDLDDN